MACKTSFELYHNFPKLAEESGFTFNIHRPRVHIDWNKIRFVDIESLIRERKFTLIEQHINDILDCILESEFDVRILDEGVLKIFRLAQLAVEYQQFCRHYLDRSIYVLREEISTLAQELDSTKRLLREKEEEIRKLRRKSKHSFRTSLPYGNDNIATMILNTLNNKANIYSTITPADNMHHNKCTYCDKVFLNQLYLESHISRRHGNVTEIPQKDTDNVPYERTNEESDKLSNEVTELRSKLANMEKYIADLGNTNKLNVNQHCNSTKNGPSNSKEMKDVEVSTNGERYILEKIEEWKKEEHELYSKELNLLRTQILTMIEANKEKEIKSTPNTTKEDSNISTELRTVIKQQGAEISTLKQELANFRSKPNSEEVELRQKIEAQMSYWIKHAELQSNEYKILLQKLDEVAKEAKTSRAQAETERARVILLQDLLQQKTEKLSNDANAIQNMTKEKTREHESTEVNITQNVPKNNTIRDRSLSLQILQQKAQELLNIDNSSTSENSPSSDEKVVDNKETLKKNQGDKNRIEEKTKTSPVLKYYKQKQKKDSKDVKQTNIKKYNHYKKSSSQKDNGKTVLPGSPVKIIRAKITEEVNSRLVSLGVDPLKSRLPQNIFVKQRMQLQELQGVKFKKYPGREEVLHSLMAHLDSNVAVLKKDSSEIEMQYFSPNKNTKQFKLSAVLSNVKSKALSLVKTNDNNPHKNSQKAYDTVAKKAMLLIKTPPSSAHSSPKNEIFENSSLKIKDLQNTKAPGLKMKPKRKSSSESTQLNTKNSQSDSEPISDLEQSTKNHAFSSTSIENLVRSPTRRPTDAYISNYSLKDGDKLLTPSQSEPTSAFHKMNAITKYSLGNNDNSSDDVESLMEHTPRRAFSEENIVKQTKGVLKNAASTSSLNKKKVIFDMEAIQMKSVSGSSPSQSITEKSENNENYGLGLTNLDNEEWDISSIENDPIQKNTIMSRTSPKIAELKQTIESQLTRRSNTMSTALVGGVDILTNAPLNRTAVGGSNTSLGSSILDDTDSTPAQNQVAFVKPRTVVEKEDSEVDISEFVADDIITRNAIKIK